MDDQDNNINIRDLANQTTTNPAYIPDLRMGVNEHGGELRLYRLANSSAFPNAPLFILASIGTKLLTDMEGTPSHAFGICQHALRSIGGLLIDAADRFEHGTQKPEPGSPSDVV